MIACLHCGSHTRAGRSTSQTVCCREFTFPPAAGPAATVLADVDVCNRLRRVQLLMVYHSTDAEEPVGREQGEEATQ